jgi:hypothetical protein
MVSRRRSACFRRQMARAHSQRLAYVRHRDGAHGTECPVGIGGFRLSRNRYNQMAAPGSRRRLSCVALRGFTVQQIPLQSNGYCLIQVGVVEPKRPASSDVARNDAIRFDAGPTHKVIDIGARRRPAKDPGLQCLSFNIYRCCHGMPRGRMIASCGSTRKSSSEAVAGLRQLDDVLYF